jgi:hypothetical protein
MSRRRSKRQGGGDKPVEIPMTDLGWSEEGEERDEGAGGDSHAAGTPGGGTAAGGLAGTNVGDGDPANADLEDALGSGVRDSGGEDEDAPAYGGPSGGAVGGTPAEKRAKGGRRGDRLPPRAERLTPGGDRPIDSTIGGPNP